MATATAITMTTASPSSATPARLKSLARQMVATLCNTHDYASPFLTAHMSPAFSAVHDGGAPSADRAAFLAQIGGAMAKMPGFHAEVLDVVAEAGEGGRAKVWVFSRMSGFPGGVVKESVDMMEWEGEVLVRGRDVQRTVVEAAAAGVE